MGRDLGEWHFDPVLHELLTIAHRFDGGVGDGRVGQCSALAAHPAVRARRSAEGDPRRALVAALEDVQNLVPAILSGNDQLELRLLLGMPGTVCVDGSVCEPCNMDPPERLEKAATVGFRSPGTYRKIRPNRNGHGWSPEVAVLSRVKHALDVLDAPESATRAYGWTRREGGAHARIDDLLGTWRGWVRSEWLLRSSEPDRPRELQSFMVFELDGGQQLTIRNFVPEATSHMVVQSVVDLPHRRRVLAIYEVATDFAPDPVRPAHRGAMLLEVDGVPARRVDGPYWTDRGTHGQLTFDERDARTASSFEAAAALFAPPAGFRESVERG